MFPMLVSAAVLLCLAALVASGSGHAQCPELERCMVHFNWHPNYFVQCLRKAAKNILWDSSQWDPCAARAAYEIAIKVDLPPERSAARLVASKLREAVLECEKKMCAGSPCEDCDFDVSRLDRFIRATETEDEGFDTMSLWRWMKMTPPKNEAAVDPVDVVIFGPFGYHNEQVVGPMLVSPFNLSGLVLLPEHLHFPSSLLKQAVFPWPLQVDVDLSAVFLKDVLLKFRPKYVYPSDEGGILVLSRLAAKLAATDTPDASLAACLERSVPLPHVYPARHLSKLIPGHEPLAPPEHIVSGNDLQTVSIAMQDVVDALVKTGERGFAKREYSEAAVGVKAYRGADSAHSSALTLLARPDGVCLLDLDIPIRIFLQKALLGVPIGCRFFSHQGRVLAISCAKVASRFKRAVMGYETVDEPDAEQRASDFVRDTNYTGFGAAWFWKDGGNGWKLVDFNARLERHHCLAPSVLNETLMVNDPCYVFQQVVTGQLDPVESQPARRLPAGITYVDPMRMAAVVGGAEYSQTVKEPWNCNENDVAHAAHVKTKLARKLEEYRSRKKEL